MNQIDTAREKGLHNHFVKKKLHHRIRHFNVANIHDLDRARIPGGLAEKAEPDWFKRAGSELQQQIRDSQKLSRTSNETLAKTLKDLKGLVEFAQPLLEQALNVRFGLKIDVTQAFFYNLKNAESSTEDQSLLQLALRNFEDGQVFTKRQFIAVRGQKLVDTRNRVLYSKPKVEETQVYAEHFAWQEGPNHQTTLYQISKLALEPGEFAVLCRELDIGQRYQDHLKATFEAPDTASTVRAQTIQAWKDSLRVHAHIANLKQLITPSAYATLLAVLNGDKDATLDGERVSFSQLHVLGSPASEMFIIGAKRREGKKVHFSLTKPGVNLIDVLTFTDSRIIVCIPGDPFAPVKEYATLRAFELDLATRLRSAKNYRAYSRLMPHGEAGKFVSKIYDAVITERWNPDLPYTLKGWLWDYKGAYQDVYREDPSLDLSESFFEDDLFDELYKRHQQRLMETAELLAVPTAKVDHDAWTERLTHYAELGLDILNVAAFFVPGLGEVMMAVMAAQLTADVYHGIEDWSIGDTDEAWGYLKSVAENLAFVAVTGAAGGKIAKVTAPASVDGLVNVKLPFGDEQLWRPSLAPYKSDVVLPAQLKPNKLGQYGVDGRTFIKLEDGAYEQTFDPRLEKWRLKHPSNPQAYHPVLEHNGQGAWRHGLERPLEWDRATLLRRMGHQTEGFDSATLEKIADISGVDEHALRKMHVDNQPMPSALADTLREFQIDRQVSELIEQIRLGQPVAEGGYSHALADVVKMPRWPNGRVIEVFERADLSGPSSRFGQASTPAKSVIRLSRAEVAAGKLPERVLATLEDQEIVQLLGGEGARVEIERDSVFSQQLADTLAADKNAIFDRISNAFESDVPSTPDLKTLQRAFPGLSREAAQEVLANATVRERLYIQHKARLPGSLLLKARSRARLTRLNKALAGMHLESMTSLDSQRLALRALEKQPGWPADVRLEIRQGSTHGKLLDAIGSESAAQTKYLVKDGYPYPGKFQAFDQYGNALSTVPRQGDGFYSAIMHALPDGARNGLGLPHVGQSAELQKNLTAYASHHRRQMMDALMQDNTGQRFKRPVRLADGRLGYPLSGRGASASVNPSLISRVRDLYPVFSDEQAGQMIRRLLIDGRTEAQIAHQLNLRSREYQALDAALVHWRATAQGDSGLLDLTVRRIRNIWQSRGLVDGEPSAFMVLGGIDSLPPLPADFSHVRNLALDSSLLLEQSSGALSRAFPNARRLDLSFMTASDPARVAEALVRLPQVKELSLYGYGNEFEAGAQQLLSAMPQLEALYVVGAVRGLDVGAMSGLRSLTMAGDMGWPKGVLDLPYVNELSVASSSINALPEEMFSGHENLWRGMKVNWSAMEPEHFMRAFEHVSSHPAHLLDVDEMVNTYCRGTLQRILVEDSAFSADVMRKLRAEGSSNRALAQRFTQLHREGADLVTELNQWQLRILRIDGQAVAAGQQIRVATAIKDCWLAGLRKQYGGERPDVVRPSTSWQQPQALLPQSAVLDLTGSALGKLPQLPELPTTGFNHVKMLNLPELMATAEDFSGFLRHFPEVRTLDLSANQLTSLPQALNELSELTELNLARNQLAVTPAVQADFNRLTSLEQLNLRLNRVDALDVTALTRLHTLRLGRTAIREWPTGVLDLAGLRQLDLSHSAIKTIPAQALTGAYTSRVNVSGCDLTPEARTGLLASDSGPRVMGIDRTQLLERRTGGLPEYYPPLVSQNPELLLPLPEIPAQELAQMPPAVRLMRLDPQLLESEAALRMEVLDGKSVVPGDVEGQIANWEAQHQALIETLNTWIEHPPHQVGDLRTATWVSALERRRAADKLLTCWRENLRGAAADVDYILDFSSTPLGSFPPLTGDFTHVGTLRLNRVYLSEQGLKGFVESFSHIHTLELDFNQLAHLPDSLTSFRQLKRLSLAGNRLTSTVELQSHLSTLAAVESLNLAENELSELDVTALTRLRDLDLHHNSLFAWPEGSLELPSLRTMNLSNNMIEALPEGLLEADPDALVRGINVTDNSLGEDQLNELGGYLERTGQGLGYTHETLDEALREFESDVSAPSDVSEEESDEDAVVDTTGDQAREQWIDSASGTTDELDGIWSEFTQTPGSGAFFKMLHKLRSTPEFRTQPGNLRRRVQGVLRAAREDATLRDVVFETANVSDTCPDGYALVFSDIEVKVYESDILKAAAGQDRANVLFRLGRVQFRLDKIESIAQDFIKQRKQLRQHYDEAEVQLAYRIGLADRLELPGQFRDMRYQDSSHVTGEMLNEAYASVLAAEQSDDLIHALVQRTYWTDFLKLENPQRFSALEQERSDRLDILGDLIPNIDDDYLEATSMLDIDMRLREAELLLELTRVKVAAFIS